MHCDLLSFIHQNRSEEKAGGGAHMSRCVCERVHSARGPRRECAAAAVVVGSAHAPLPSIRQNERASERDEQTSDADAILCRIYLKIDNWNG